MNSERKELEETSARGLATKQSQGFSPGLLRLEGLAMTFLIIVTGALDQLLKYLAENNFLPSALGPLKILISLNSGAVFNLPAPNYLSASISAIIICILVFWLFCRPPLSAINRLALALLIGGGAGNLLDRLTIGGVRDIFILRTSHFNLADAFIALALGLFLLSLLFSKES